MKKAGIKELISFALRIDGTADSFIGLVDQMAWNTWRQVAPSSSLKRTSICPPKSASF
jgi:hypothetical protein